MELVHPVLIILAFGMASKEPDWEAFKQRAQERFSEWEESRRGDFGQFLNEQILALPKIESEASLKRAVMWLALYKEKKQLAPAAIRDLSDKYGAQIRGLDASRLTWKELLEKIQASDGRAEGKESRNDAAGTGGIAASEPEGPAKHGRTGPSAAGAKEGL